MPLISVPIDKENAKASNTGKINVQATPLKIINVLNYLILKLSRLP